MLFVNKRGKPPSRVVRLREELQGKGLMLTASTDTSLTNVVSRG